MSRVIYIDAGIFEHPIFAAQPFTEREAWMWLAYVWDRSNPHLVHQKLKWPPNRVWRVLRKLMAAGLLDRDEFRDVELLYRKKARRTPIPLAMKATVAERDGKECRYCGSTDGPFHIDHVFPWSKGGEHKPANLVMACRPCNLKKRDKTLKELGWTI